MDNKLIDDHLSVCEYRRVTCPNECEALVRLNALQQHLDNDCPLQHIPCPMAPLDMCKDCPGTLERGSLREHVVNSSVKPKQIFLLASEYSKVERENEQLKDRLQQLISTSSVSQANAGRTTKFSGCDKSDVTVCDAGRGEVNGTYRYLKTGTCNAGIYERMSFHHDEDSKPERITLYKVALNLKKAQYRWFISNTTRDLYWAFGYQFDSTPPCEWYCMSDIPRPAPVVAVCSQTVRNSGDNPFSSVYSSSNPHKKFTTPKRITTLRNNTIVSPSSISDDMDNYLFDFEEVQNDDDPWGGDDDEQLHFEEVVREGVRASLDETRMLSASMLR
eukprot:gene41045-50787_t